MFLFVVSNILLGLGLASTLIAMFAAYVYPHINAEFRFVYGSNPKPDFHVALVLCTLAIITRFFAQ